MSTARITTSQCDPRRPGFVDHFEAIDQDGRCFYAPTQAEAEAMARDYNRPLLKRAPRRKAANALDAADCERATIEGMLP